jgi:hypothetical protein
MERVAAPQGGMADGEVVASLAPFPDGSATRALEHLALTARATPGQAGREALNLLHHSLAALTPNPENAALLLRLLDEGAFNELRADDGSSTRELAVETLLRLGYPWALQVHPDELAWYRTSIFLRKRNKLLILLAVMGLAVGLATYLYTLF